MQGVNYGKTVNLSQKLDGYTDIYAVDHPELIQFIKTVHPDVAIEKPNKSNRMDVTAKTV